MARTIVYIDGFNFYYGCIKGSPYRWLNLLRFAKLVLPKNDVIKVKYFTAIVKPTANDQSKAVRQQTYLRALATIPDIEIFLGSFQSHPVRRPLADGGGSVVVTDMKEKGSDVNLATELLVDAFENAFDVAAVISNDSDLVAPIRAVRTDRQTSWHHQSASPTIGRASQVLQLLQGDQDLATCKRAAAGKTHR